MMNVGHTYPGVSDMDTIGTPAKYSLCAAENEEASPWSPYHVEHGFEADTSTVTVHFNYGLCDLYDFYNWEPDRLIEVFASAATNVGILSTGLWLIGRRTDPRNQTEQREHYTLFIAPEHAKIFGSAGWSKDDVKQAMYRKARLPFRTLMLNKNPAALSSSHPELAWLWDSQDTMLPISSCARPTECSSQPAPPSWLAWRLASPASAIDRATIPAAPTVRSRRMTSVSS